MTFEPMPENDFPKFIETYHSECKSRIPKIAAIMGKWNFEDLVPGLSDFDSRFFYEDGLEVEEWIETSREIGRVHYRLAEAHPEWARKLEHPPGINLTWSELLDRDLYLPESRQWSFYHGDQATYRRVYGELEARPWSNEDELYFLNKFFAYYAPYNRSIDPPINMRPFESKYPLHSRIMHYFLPPLQSALSVLLRRAVRGKLEALRIAADHGGLPSIPVILHSLEHHYEVPLYYREPYLSNLENMLKADLDALFEEIKSNISVFETRDGMTSKECRVALAGIQTGLALQIFSSLRFARTIKGRLVFYANPPQHFETYLLLVNELGRIGSLFLNDPVKLFWRLRCGEGREDVPGIVRDLKGELWSDREIEIILQYHGYTNHFDRGMPEESMKRRALEVASIFDDYYRAIVKLLIATKNIVIA